MFTKSKDVKKRIPQSTFFVILVWAKISISELAIWPKKLKTFLEIQNWTQKFDSIFKKKILRPKFFGGKLCDASYNLFLKIDKKVEKVEKCKIQKKISAVRPV